MNFDGVRVALGFQAIEIIEQPRLRNDAPALMHEGIQDSEFLRGEIDRIAADRHGSPRRRQLSLRPRSQATSVWIEATFVVSIQVH